MADTPDPKVEMLKRDKQDAFDYRKRRDDDWIENYTLSRDKVIVNRLTQRQTVNLPVMKTVIKTILKDVDDMPVLYFENLDSDKQAEIFKNEYWKMIGDENHNKFELLDIIDKRQVIEFGRSYDQLQIIDGMPNFTIVDARDILVPRYNDPSNIDNNRFLIHCNIYVPLATLENNPEYDQQAIKELMAWYHSREGLIKQAENQEMKSKRDELANQMGDMNAQSPLSGETIIEISQHFVYRKEPGEKKEKLWVYVMAENYKILLEKPLDEVIGKTKDNYWQNHFPYNSWADDVEKQDWYSDGIADIVRPTARVVNVWWSQLVENRTLRSFGMNIYNAGLEGFTPETWEAKPWGWYGMPVPEGKSLSEVYQNIQIPDLGDSLNEMTFAIGMIEKATGATATQQGAESSKQITLGEVQLALSEAKERVKGMSKFYTQVWKERGNKFIKLLEAAPDKLDAVKIYKKGRMTDAIYAREVSPDDWKSVEGYRCKVWSQDEKQADTQEAVTKQSAIKQNMPDNPVVDEVFKRKLLEFGEYTPDEINKAMEYETQKREAMMAMTTGMGSQNAPMAPGSMQPGLPATNQPALESSAPPPALIGGGK